jgi:hypothetical protein
LLPIILLPFRHRWVQIDSGKGKKLQNLNLIDRGLEEKWQEEKRLIYYKKYNNPGIPS